MKKQKLIGALLAGVMAVSSFTAVPALSDTFVVAASAASKLAAPANVTAKSSSSTEITLSWDAVKGASKYRVYMYDALNEKYTKYGDVDADALSLRIAGLKAGCTYKFRVAALVKSGNSYTVQTKSKAVKASPKLPAPLYLTTSVGSSSAEISWFSVSGADAYRVYKYDSKTKKYVKYKNVTGTSCTVTGLKEGNTYKFKVAALVEYSGSYKVQTLSKEVTVTPKKPEAITLPKMPVLGTKGIDAVKQINPANYSYYSSETGCVYSCGTDPKSVERYSMYMLLCTKSDDLYGVLYTVSGENLDTGSLLKTLESKNGKAMTYTDKYSTTYFWENGNKVEMYVPTDHGSSYGSVVYVTLDLSIAPKELVENYKKFKDAFSSGKLSEGGSIAELMM